MDLQKIAVKIFADGGKEIPLPVFIDIFQSCIQASDGTYHDVADYSHMHAGPGIVLLANDANVSIDESEKRRGLLYSRKAPLSGTNREKIRTVLQSAFNNCRRLQREAAVGGKLTFRGSEVAITINDRLVAPNSEATFAGLKSDLETALRDVLGDASFTLKRNNDRRQRFSVTVRAAEHLDLQTS
jgi:hypothetical protein